MPWTGPNFIRENGPTPIFTGSTAWQQDAAAGTLILASRHDFHDQDLAQGIDACLNKNGANTIAADINWGGFKITSLGNGILATDAANYGQTVTAAALDSGTNILTLTRAAGDITVDLTSLVVGGSTSNFAKLNASDNVFVGQAEFGGPLTCTDSFIIDHTTGGSTDNWTWNCNNPALLTLRPSIGGMQFNFVRSVGDPNGGYMQVNGFKVWDQSLLPLSQVNSFLLATTNANITGSWNFYNGNITLPAATTFGTATGGGWTTSNTGTVFQLFANANGDVFKLDHDATEGQRAFVNGHRLWSNNNYRVLTAAPTGGVANDLAVVVSGADRGLWYNNAGSWAKLIPFP